MQKVKNFIRQHKKIFLPYIIENFEVSWEELNTLVCEMWDSFSSPHMVENMLITNYKDTCYYYEICDTKYNRGKFIHKDKIWDHCRYNNRNDQHISVYRHDKQWVANVKRTNSVSCSNTRVSADWIYVELDREEGYEKAVEDALEIYKSFPYKDRMELWFSGNNSVHIAVHASLFGNPIGSQETVCGLGKLFYNLAHKICGDIRYKNGCVDPWLMDENEVYKIYYETFGEAKTNGDISNMKQKLENTDPNLYRVNSLIRQPWSIHEKSGNKKELIKPEKKLDIGCKKPYLIHWVNECYEPKYKKQVTYTPNLDDSKVEKIFSVIEGFNPKYADQSGWINNLYSPFYNDTKPSVAVNIKTGYYVDHGEPTHSFGIVEFYSKIKGIDYEEAKEYITKN